MATTAAHSSGRSALVDGCHGVGRVSVPATCSTVTAWVGRQRATPLERPRRRHQWWRLVLVEHSTAVVPCRHGVHSQCSLADSDWSTTTSLVGFCLSRNYVTGSGCLSQLASASIVYSNKQTVWQTISEDEQINFDDSQIQTLLAARSADWRPETGELRIARSTIVFAQQWLGKFAHSKYARRTETTQTVNLALGALVSQQHIISVYALFIVKLS